MSRLFHLQLDEEATHQPGVSSDTHEVFSPSIRQLRSTRQESTQSMFDDPEFHSSQIAGQLSLPRLVGHQYEQQSLEDSDSDGEYESGPNSETSSPKKPKHAKAQGPPPKTNELFKNLVKDEEGLYFGSAEDVFNAFADDPLWKPAKEELPYGEERLPYVMRIKDALLHLPAAESMTAVALDGTTGDTAAGSLGTAVGRGMTTPKDAKNKCGRGGGLARWTGGYYQLQAIEAAAHLLVDRVVALHELGWSRPNLDPKQLDVKRLYQPELSFDERINSIERVLKSKKHTCKWVLDNDDLVLDKLVGGPEKYEERSNTNKVLNDSRQIVLKFGRKEVSKSEDRSKTQPTAKPKRKASQIAIVDSYQINAGSGPSTPKRRQISALPSRNGAIHGYAQEKAGFVQNASVTRAYRSIVNGVTGGSLLHQDLPPTNNNNRFTPAIGSSNLRRSERVSRMATNFGK
ncbi:hypothetical protein BU16DRAFT_560159 [Lophium mytilinum]|uniref:Uncharacterized protein n=1 Tax=Lophium mytilinum TaxID=390894 RepID=A0A6A6QYJ0_9PEZI|nr:hypothetical protein BU16DRAFT_560159 [Lophium mytilinum]